MRQCNTECKATHPNHTHGGIFLPPPKIDWHDLLVRYMAEVIAYEGITFLQYFSSKFTEREEELLGGIEEEAREVLCA